MSVSLVSRPLQFGTERPVAHREIRSDISLAIDTDAVVGSPRLSVVVAQLAGMYYL